MLAARNLEVVYDDVVLALRGVSLEVADEQIVALLGSNGAGKTTLLRALSGLLDIHDGEITKGVGHPRRRVAEPVRARAIVRHGVSQVLEGRRVFVELTVEENLRVGAHTARTELGDNLDRVYDLFPVLRSAAGPTAGYLSGGEQQMLAMGRALMSDPRYLLLDEPSLGLAPKLVEARSATSSWRSTRPAPACSSSSRTPPWRCRSPHHGYVLETGRVVMDKPAAELLDDDDVREFYLGLTRRGRRAQARSATSSTTGAGSGGRHERPHARRSSSTDVHLSFDGVTAINGVSFTVAPSELFAIIGPNGAGKTSLFNVLSGVYRPQEGRCASAVRTSSGSKPYDDRRAGHGPHLPEHRAVRAPDRARQPDARPPPAHPATARSRRSAGSGRARREELEHRAGSRRSSTSWSSRQWRKLPVGLLPYGVQKRVELGRALAMEPKLLLLDEPVAGMNLEETEDMARFILDIRDELDVPIIMVEHDMGLVMDLADRVMVVDFGVPITTGTPAEVQRDPDVVRAYLGERPGQDAHEPTSTSTTTPATRIRDRAAATPDRGRHAGQALRGLAGVAPGREYWDAASSSSPTRCSTSASSPATGSPSSPRTAPSG